MARAMRTVLEVEEDYEIWLDYTPCATSAHIWRLLTVYACPLGVFCKQFKSHASIGYDAMMDSVEQQLPAARETIRHLMAQTLPDDVLLEVQDVHFTKKEVEKGFNDALASITDIRNNVVIDIMVAARNHSYYPNWIALDINAIVWWKGTEVDKFHVYLERDDAEGDWRTETPDEDPYFSRSLDANVYLKAHTMDIVKYAVDLAYEKTIKQPSPTAEWVDWLDRK